MLNVAWCPPVMNANKGHLRNTKIPFPSNRFKSVFGDIYVPKCWVDLSFNSRVILDIFLFCNWKLIWVFKRLLFWFQSKNALFLNKKKSRIILEFQLNSSSGHINVTFDAGTDWWFEFKLSFHPFHVIFFQLAMSFTTSMINGTVKIAKKALWLERSVIILSISKVKTKNICTASNM